MFDESNAVSYQLELLVPLLMFDESNAASY